MRIGDEELSVQSLVDFIKISEEDRREIAELICAIYEQLGHEGLELLQKFTTALKDRDMASFSQELMRLDLPLSLISNLLALGQELEAHTREHIDKLLELAKQKTIELTKVALQKALVILLT